MYLKSRPYCWTGPPRKSQGSFPVFTLAVLTTSDMGARGEREDTSGEAIREILGPPDYQLKRYEVVPDEQAIATIHRTLDLGANYLDVAPLYGYGMAQPR